MCQETGQFDVAPLKKGQSCPSLYSLASRWSIEVDVLCVDNGRQADVIDSSTYFSNDARNVRMEVVVECF